MYTKPIENGKNTRKTGKLQYFSCSKHVTIKCSEIVPKPKVK